MPTKATRRRSEFREPDTLSNVTVGDPAMSREHGLQSCVTLPSIRASRRRPMVPVLIQVPTRSWSRDASATTADARRRRRLRREVRMAGYAVMAAAPLVVVALMLCVARPRALARIVIASATRRDVLNSPRGSAAP